MRRIPAYALATALLAPLTSVNAEVNLDSHCRFESRYGLEIDGERVGFTRKTTSTTGPARIEFVGDGIRVDGEDVVLSRADRELARQFHREIQAMVPQVRAIVRDSIDIAFVALSTVVTQFADAARREELLQELIALKNEAMQAVAAAKSSEALKDSVFEQRVEAAVKRIVPTLAAEFAAQAVRVALSGNEDAAAEIERRANKFGAEIERAVEGAAKSLESRATALCPQVQALDAIDNRFEWRLADGSKPALLEYSDAEASSKAR